MPGQQVIVGFVSQKGGTGKSTLARALGAVVAGAGLKVKIADLDPQQQTVLQWEKLRSGWTTSAAILAFRTRQPALIHSTRSLSPSNCQCAGAGPSLVGGGFTVAGGTLGSVVGPTYGGDRIEGIRYDSANLGGFVVQGVWGEDDVWSASIRYAGEFGGIRVAAGIGYQEQDPNNLPGGLDTGNASPLTRAESEWSGSLALMHTASGLFVQGHYAQSDFFNGADARFWMVQGGISKNWFGMGNTSLYAEIGNAEDYARSTALANTSDVDFFGLGVVQQIDAAAMELYLGWRRFEVDRNGAEQELDIVNGGARIRF